MSLHYQKKIRQNALARCQYVWLELSSRTARRRLKQVVKLPAEWKRHPSDAMPPILTFLFFLSPCLHVHTSEREQKRNIMSLSYVMYARTILYVTRMGTASKFEVGMRHKGRQ